MHHCIKFCQNWSFLCWDIAIFRIFKMAAVRHLGFVWGIFGPPTVSIWGGSITLQNLVMIDAVVFIMNISIFGLFGWKMPIHAPKIGVLGQFDPLINPRQKRHILAWVRVIWAVKCVNLASSLTCRCVSLKRGINKKHFRLYFTYLLRSPPWTDYHQILHSCRSRGRNHLWQIF